MVKGAKLLMLNLVCILLWSGNLTSAGQTIVIKGSTTVLPVTQAAAEAYMKLHPGMNISLSGGGSGEGIKALIDRSTDIATSSRDIKEEEVKLARSRGVNPVAHRVAIDAIVPVVHPTNPVKNLTAEQLSLVYQGKITNWREVGGKDLKIMVISRDSSSGTYETWGEKVLHGARVTPRAQLQASSGAIVQAVSKNRYAMGYIGIGYLNKRVKALTVNGIQASAETALSGAYPIVRPLFMFTNGRPSGEAGSFIKFLLGEEGQKIVQREGFVPIKKR
ncbi:MAG: PstS family phosphate ABC transporter substrate-binding protein [Syntrophales bacterium]|nr:PstS family phosphate ABC transporter substrate-binding protein [Syntrophales bacterium]